MNKFIACGLGLLKIYIFLRHSATFEAGNSIHIFMRWQLSRKGKSEMRWHNINEHSIKYNRLSETIGYRSLGAAALSVVNKNGFCFSI
jgi:hypothetical protein